MELWRSIPGFPGFEASNTGLVKKLGRLSKDKTPKKGRGHAIAEKILKTHVAKGYLRCTMNDKNESVHRIVALAWKPRVSEDMHVNHIDGNKQNNCVDNLEWVTYQENVDHSRKENLVPKTFSRRKLTVEQVVAIRSSSETNGKLATKYGIRYEMVQRIRNRRAWKHIA